MYLQIYDSAQNYIILHRAVQRLSQHNLKISQHRYIYKPGHIKCEPGSSVNTVYGYGLDDRSIEVRSPAEVEGLFL
jgi:hypothetical protein